MLSIEGKAVVVPGVISTDDILPARYKHMFTEHEKLAEYVFSIRYPQISSQLVDIIILATDTFGIGSSREQAVGALLGAGVVMVIAPRFGRIFFRNCWNLGLPAIEMDTDPLLGAKEMQIDLRKGQLTTDKKILGFSPPPERMIKVVKSGGLLASLAQSQKQRSDIRERGHYET